MLDERIRADVLRGPKSDRHACVPSLLASSLSGGKTVVLMLFSRGTLRKNGTRHGKSCQTITSERQSWKEARKIAQRQSGSNLRKVTLRQDSSKNSLEDLRSAHTCQGVEKTLAPFHICKPLFFCEQLQCFFVDPIPCATTQKKKKSGISEDFHMSGVDVTVSFLWQTTWVSAQCK